MQNIEIGGTVYPAEVNFKVILEFEKYVGYALHELKSSKEPFQDGLRLIYVAIIDGYAAQGKTFEMSFDDFFRSVMPDDVARIEEWRRNSKFMQQMQEPKGTKKKENKVSPQ